MKKWQDEYPELIAAREFRDEDLEGFFGPEVNFWYTSAFCGKPCEIVGPKTCISEVLEKDLGLYIQVANTWDKEGSSRFIYDMQNQPGKGIFTSEETAQAYHEMCLNIFNKCPEWQAEHAELAKESRRRDNYYPEYE